MAGNNAIVTKRSRKSKRSNRKSADGVGQYASDAWSLAKRTAYGLNEIRKLINIETKFCDTGLTASTISNNGNVTCISELAQGLTSTNRVGDSIKIQHIEVRGRVTIAATGSNTAVRCLVFRDLDGYGTAPVGADVLESTGSALAPFSPYHFNRRERFSILYDETFMTQAGATYDGISSFPFYFSTAHGGHVLYLGATAAAASDGKGSVYVLLIGDEGTTLPLVTFYSRILFTDD